jgi:hypothetical protein
MAYDGGLAERIRDVLGASGRIVERRMFGGLAFMVDGHMAVGILGEALIARVGPERHARALAQPHARPMDFTGRPMTGYVFVDPPGFARDADLAAWVGECVQFVKTLPRKPGT